MTCLPTGRRAPRTNRRRRASARPVRSFAPRASTAITIPNLRGRRIDAGLAGASRRERARSEIRSESRGAGRLRFISCRSRARAAGLGLKELEPGELKQLENQVEADPELRNFVLAGLQSAGAYYDAIVAASKMEKRGELSHPAAERIRYPRAYWDLIA